MPLQSHDDTDTLHKRMYVLKPLIARGFTTFKKTFSLGLMLESAAGLRHLGHGGTAVASFRASPADLIRQPRELPVHYTADGINGSASSPGCQA